MAEPRAAAAPSRRLWRRWKKGGSGRWVRSGTDGTEKISGPASSSGVTANWGAGPSRVVFYGKAPGEAPLP